MTHSCNTLFELVEAAPKDISAPFTQFLDGVVIEDEPALDHGCDIEVVEGSDLLILCIGAVCLLRYRLPIEYV